MPSAIITGTGSYLPEQRLTNQELEHWVFVNSKGDEYHVTSDEVVAKTGILERRIATTETLSYMAAEASKNAIKDAGLHPDDIDLVLLATTTPDYKLPKTSPLMAIKADMHGVAAYDFGKDSSGFLETLEAAAYYIIAGRYQNILVVGADKCSSFVNRRNKATTVIFGDGAGAVVLSAVEDPERGFLSAVAGSQGESFDKLLIPAGGSTEWFSPHTPESRDKLFMDGKAVAGYASQVFTMGVERVLAQEQLVPENLDVLIPHQANLRIIEAGAKALDFPMSKVIITLDKIGNTAAGSVPIAIDSAKKSGRLKNGNLVCLTAYGAGFSWIAALMRW